MYKIATLLVLISSLIVSKAFANDTESDLMLSYGDEDFISIATGRKQLISMAPAVASVITAEDISAMGTTDIDEILESVPGLHVSYSNKGYNPIYVMRGIHSGDNPQVLLLINGIPLTNVFLGDRSQVWGGMPVNNISRIEIIRGPGSAIYGADAFAGTINIITRTASEIDGIESGIASGSFDTYRAWLLYGKSRGDWQTSFSLELLDTSGQDEIVTADQQTFFDQLLGTEASLAPGSVNSSKTSLETRLDIKYKEWQVRLGYQGRRDVGTGAGVFQALDPVGQGDADRINVDFTYHNAQVGENWDVKAQLSYFDVTTLSDLVLLPPGFAGAFPDGVIGNPDVYERHYRSDFSAFYTGFDSHDIRIGTGFHYQDLYRVEETKNFTIAIDPTFGPLILPLGGVVDVSDTTPFTQEKTRKIYYLSLQDEWKFARDWSLTTGVRFDDYSDFGSTVNPRLALVWQTAYNLTTKALYGRSFRAPSFAEQFNINNPVALGNEDLDPEIVNTYELAFDYAYSESLRVGLNLFHYKMEDIIRFAPTVANNTGDQTGSGVEIEFEWDATKNLKVLGNYAFQDAEDKDSNSDAPNAPQNQVYLRADYNFASNWHFNTQLNMVMDRARAAGDLRPEVDDYTTLDVTLRAEDVFAGLDLSVSARNLADEDVYEPSLAPGFIPNDLPLAGRSVFAEIRKSW